MDSPIINPHNEAEHFQDLAVPLYQTFLSISVGLQRADQC